MRAPPQGERDEARDHLVDRQAGRVDLDGVARRRPSGSARGSRSRSSRVADLVPGLGRGARARSSRLGGQPDLQLGVGRDDGADVAALGDPVARAISARCWSTSAARTAGSAARARGELGDLRRADRLGDVVAVEQQRSPSNAIRSVAPGRGRRRARRRGTSRPVSRYVKPSAGRRRGRRWTSRPPRGRRWRRAWRAATIGGETAAPSARARFRAAVGRDDRVAAGRRHLPGGGGVAGLRPRQRPGRAVARRTAWTARHGAFLLTGGVVTDRVDRRRVLIAADLVRAVALVGDGRAVARRRDRDLAPRRARRALRRGEAFFGPALRRAVPGDRRAEQLVQANALEQLVRQACERLSGPALGGLWSPPSGPATRSCRRRDVRARAPRASGDASVRGVPAGLPATVHREMVEGLRYVRSQPWLWVTLASAASLPAAVPRPARGAAPVRRAQRPRRRRRRLRAGPRGRRRGLRRRCRSSLSQRGLPRRYLTVLYAAVERRDAAVRRLRVRRPRSGSSWSSPRCSGACDDRPAW